MNFKRALAYAAISPFALCFLAVTLAMSPILLAIWATTWGFDTLNKTEGAK